MGRNDKSTWSLCRYVCSGAMSLGPIDTFRGQGRGTSAIYANDEASIQPCPPPFHNLSLCELRCARARNHAMRLLNSRSGTRRLDLYRGLTASAK